MTAQNAILTPWGRAQTKFMELAKTEGNPNTITRHEFQEALSYVGIQERDQEILDRLFTMFDKMGDNQVPHPGARPPRAERARARGRERTRITRPQSPRPACSAQINFREFIVGISPLAKGTVQVRALASAKGLDLAFLSHHLTACGARASSLLQDKLHFSFTLYDIDQTQQIKQACPRVPPRCVCIGRALSHAPPLSPCGAG